MCALSAARVSAAFFAHLPALLNRVGCAGTQQKIDELRNQASQRHPHCWVEAQVLKDLERKTGVNNELELKVRRIRET